MTRDKQNNLKKEREFTPIPDSLKTLFSQIESSEAQINKLKTKLKIMEDELHSLREEHESFQAVVGTAIVTLNRGGIIQDVNQAGVQLLGEADTLLGRPFVSFVHRESLCVFQEQLLQSIGTTNSLSLNMNLTIQGTIVPVRLSVIRRTVRGHKHYVLAIEDRTVTSNYELELNRSVQQWLSIVRSAPDIILLIMPDGAIRFANRPWLTLSTDQMIGRNILSYVAEAERQQVGACLLRAFDRGTVESCDIRVPFDGMDRWFNLRFGPIPRPSTNGYAYVEQSSVIIREITNEKQSERIMRRTTEILRGLTARTEEIREDERGRIAREVHDELGQVITVLKMDMAWIKAKMRGQPKPVRERMNEMDQSLDVMIHSVRRIASELVPPMLNELGLIPALEWQLEQFQKRSGILCNVTVRPADVPLDKERSTSLFRVVQETLTNIARHADATELKFELGIRDGELVISIADNGKGIRPNDIQNPESFGLTGMRERMRRIGGQFRIEGVDKQGTCITIKLPLKNSSENP